MVLLGILAAIFVKEGLGLDAPWASKWPVASGGGTFTLCSRGNQAQCVVDGDTIHHAGLKIRLEDIDAPETYQYKCASELALGQRATNRLLELINAGPFELVNRGGRDEDRYGRKLRTIECNGRSLGEILVAEGLARHWDGARRSWCSPTNAAPMGNVRSRLTRSILWPRLSSGRGPDHGHLWSGSGLADG